MQNFQTKMYLSLFKKNSASLASLFEENPKEFLNFISKENFLTNLNKIFELFYKSSIWTENNYKLFIKFINYSIDNLDEKNKLFLIQQSFIFLNLERSSISKKTFLDKFLFIKPVIFEAIERKNIDISSIAKQLLFYILDNDTLKKYKNHTELVKFNQDLLNLVEKYYEKMLKENNTNYQFSPDIFFKPSVFKYLFKDNVNIEKDIDLSKVFSKEDFIKFKNMSSLFNAFVNHQETYLLEKNSFTFFHKINQDFLDFVFQKTDDFNNFLTPFLKEKYLEKKYTINDFFNIEQFQKKVNFTPPNLPLNSVSALILNEVLFDDFSAYSYFHKIDYKLFDLIKEFVVENKEEGQNYYTMLETYYYTCHAYSCNFNDYLNIKDQYKDYELDTKSIEEMIKIIQSLDNLLSKYDFNEPNNQYIFQNFIKAFDFLSFFEIDNIQKHIEDLQKNGKTKEVQKQKEILKIYKSYNQHLEKFHIHLEKISVAHNLKFIEKFKSSSLQLASFLKGNYLIDFSQIENKFLAIVEQNHILSNIDNVDNIKNIEKAPQPTKRFKI